LKNTKAKEAKMVKIMVVDSEEHVRLLYNEELRDAGYFSVVLVETPFRLMERIASEKPDIIIIGVRLLDYDPWVVLADIRKNFPHTEIIFNTSREEYWPLAREMGVRHFARKSSNLSDLLKEIGSIIENDLFVS